MLSRHAQEKYPGHFWIELDGQCVRYTLKSSIVARYARIEVKPDTGLCIIIPYSYPTALVAEIIKDKKTWVLRKLAQFQKTLPTFPADANSIQYLGRTLNIEWRINGDFKPWAALDGNRLVLHLPPDDDGKLLVESWLKEQAAGLIKNLVDAHGRKIGVKYRFLRLRAARTRWGSCSPRGNLSFNWKLITAAPEAIDYVVVHELCHLKELNHSPAFWKLVENHCTGWKAQRKWLRDNEALLAL